MASNLETLPNAPPLRKLLRPRSSISAGDFAWIQRLPNWSRRLPAWAPIGGRHERN
jgi:hypothetical protein